jgi:hypothetical protein
MSTAFSRRVAAHGIQRLPLGYYRDCKPPMEADREADNK